MNATLEGLRRRLRGLLPAAVTTSILAFSTAAGAQQAPAPPLAPQRGPITSPADTAAPAAPPAAPAPPAAGSSAPDFLMPVPAEKAAPEAAAPEAAAPEAAAPEAAAPEAVAPEAAAPEAAATETAASEPEPPADAPTRAASKHKRKRKPKPYVAPRGPYMPDPRIVDMDNQLKRESHTASFMKVTGHIFLWPYLASALVGGVVAECKKCEDEKHLAWLLLPGAGPFIATAFMNDKLSEGARGVLLVDGAIQTTAIAAFVLTGLSRRSFMSGGSAARGPSVQVGPAGPGLGITGTF